MSLTLFPSSLTYQKADLHMHVGRHRKVLFILAASCKENSPMKEAGTSIRTCAPCIIHIHPSSHLYLRRQANREWRANPANHFKPFSAALRFAGLLFVQVLRLTGNSTPLTASTDWTWGPRISMKELRRWVQQEGNGPYRPTVSSRVKGTEKDVAIWDEFTTS